MRNPFLQIIYSSISKIEKSLFQLAYKYRGKGQMSSLMFGTCGSIVADFRKFCLRKGL